MLCREFCGGEVISGVIRMNECLVCGGAVKNITTSVKTNWAGKHPLTISGIPAEQCEVCGEITFSLEATRMIQSISRGIAEDRTGEKPDFLALPEVAALLQVSHQTIYNMIRDGRLQAKKAGREWRFHRADLDKLFALPALRTAKSDAAGQHEIGAAKARNSRTRKNEQAG